MEEGSDGIEKCHDGTGAGRATGAALPGRCAGTARLAAARQPAADDGVAHPPRRRGLGAALRSAVQAALRPAAGAGGGAPRERQRRAARPAGRLSAAARDGQRVRRAGRASRPVPGRGQGLRDQRRMVMAGFAPHAIKAYFPALVTVALRLQGRWRAAAADGLAIDLMDDLKRYTVDIIAGLAFGAEVNTIDGGEDVIQRHLDQVLPGVARRGFAWFPYWRYVRLPSDRRLERSMAAINGEITALIVAARARMAADPARRERPVNLLEAMIAAADEGGSGVDDIAVAGNVMTMLLAGEDTTANTLAWMLYLLRRHPEALRRAQEEVRRLAPDPAGFTVEQMDSLDFLDACTQEAMRLKPVAPFIPLEAIRDTLIEDVAVPKDTLVWCVLRHDGVDEQLLPRAGQFEPQRWLAQGEAAFDKRLTQPFGGGVRTCPGRYLALLEIKIAMAMLLSSFELDAVDGPDGGEAQELMGFVMSPVGLTMRLRPRPRADAPAAERPYNAVAIK